MKVRIVFRPSRAGKQEGYLSLRIYYGQHVRQIATGLCMKKEEWEKKKNGFETGSSSLPRLHGELQNKVGRLEQLLMEYHRKGNFCIDSLIREFRKMSSPLHVSVYIGMLAGRLIKQNRTRTAEAYRTVMRRLIAFNSGKDFLLEKLSGDFIKDFERRLYSEGLSQNSVSFYMRNLRAIYNKAIEEKLLAETLQNPFQRVFTGLRPTPKRALGKEDINKVYSLDFRHILKKKRNRQIVLPPDRRKSLELSRDIFLFSFHARGMSFGDFVYLKKTDIQNGVLSYRRRKTGRQLDIRISKNMGKLIKKYSKLASSSPYLFPVIEHEAEDSYRQYQTALRRQNRNLKEIQKLAGIERLITTHVARHSWATIAKEENLPVWTISESLGHASVSTTYIYLDSIDRNKLDEASDIVARAAGF
jgi:integrase